MAKFSPAVQAARQRRASRAGQSAVEVESYVREVSERIDMTFRQRVFTVVAFLKNRIVQNISVPVTKEKIGKHVRVTERSKPGEFPRADTTQLMKSIFWDVVEDGEGRFTGHVGTPVGYSVPLELMLDRRFLTRTLDEELPNLRSMLTGPIT